MARRRVHRRFVVVAGLLTCSGMIGACLGSDARTGADRALTAEPTVAVAADVGTAAAGAGGAPTPEEAERVVRAYFTAADDEAYDRMREHTSGQARGRTAELIGEILRQEGEAGIDADLRVTRLETSVRPAQGDSRPVRVDCEIAAYIDAGLINMKLRELRSSATFLVARAPGGAKVVRLEGQLTP